MPPSGKLSFVSKRSVEQSTRKTFRSLIMIALHSCCIAFNINKGFWVEAPPAPKLVSKAETIVDHASSLFLDAATRIKLFT